MDRERPHLQLRAQGGRVILLDRGKAPGPRQVRALGLTDDLVRALQEWARVADVVGSTEESGERVELVSRRGRQLATRVAGTTGVPVSYVDPLSGSGVEPERIGPPPRASSSEPTPWGTGLTVSAATAAVVAVALIALGQVLAEIDIWLAAAGELLVAMGLAPATWLARTVPVWRWVALGVAAGVLLGWGALAATALTT